MENGSIFPYRGKAIRAKRGRRRIGQPVIGFRCQTYRTEKAVGKPAAGV